LSTENVTSVKESASAFVTTQWTQVLNAKGGSAEARMALSDLCAAYYAPVFAFIRRRTRDEDAARDLSQEFFARLLAREGIGSVDPERGRFRSFLLGAVKHFLSDNQDHAQRLKRGGGLIMEPAHAGTDTSPGFEVKDPAGLSPDREFDRKWALTILERALATLATEHKATGNEQHFETLKPWLTGDAGETSQAEAGRQLNLNEGAVKVAVHRLRRRFRQVIKAQISHTLANPEQVEEEMRHLIEALG
jgi:RNA polymerase sigma-70 factor (ECF subfamily)